jgi:hypothetical protein
MLLGHACAQYADFTRSLPHLGTVGKLPGITYSTLGIWARGGRAQFHMGVTRKRNEIEIANWVTRKYEPPDTFVDGGNRSTSRLYDVWSLGRVFLEAVVWILYGLDELKNFDDTTSRRKTQGTSYWTRRGDSAEISQMAGLWMSTILDKDPECNVPGESALADLMKLIKNKMLVVELPPNSDEFTPGCRKTLQQNSPKSVAKQRKMIYTLSLERVAKGSSLRLPETKQTMK